MTDTHNSLRTTVWLLFISLVVISGAACCSRLTPLTATSTPRANPPTATVAAARFRPGDPTATPPGGDITDPNFIEAVEAYWVKDYERVIQLMENVVASDPALAPPYWYRGMALGHLDHCQEGLDDMELALERDPGYALAIADRGWLHNCLGHISQAVADSRRALELDPSLAKVRERLGLYYFNEGDFDRALEEFNLAVEIDPTRAGAWMLKGKTVGVNGKFDECREDTTRALELDPQLWSVYRERGLCAILAGDNEAGIADMELYLDNDPDDMDTWYNLGIGYRQVGRLEDALEAYGRVLESDPGYYQAMINSASIFISQGKFDEAVVTYTRALSFGEIPAAYLGRGDAYLALGQFDEAEADFERVIELFPFTPEPHCRLVHVYFAQERWTGVLHKAEEAGEVWPECRNDQRLLEMQALASFELGLYDDAIELMDRALSQGFYVAGLYYQGRIYDEAGKISEAIDNLEDFLRLADVLGGLGEEVADAQVRLTRLRLITPTPVATPPALVEAISFGDDGLTKVTIAAGETRLFRFQPESTVQIERVGDLFINFEMEAATTTSPGSLVFYVWNETFGIWDNNGGHNELPVGPAIYGVQAKDEVVRPNGVFHFSIENRGSTSILIEKLSIWMRVLVKNGQEVNLGVVP